MLKPYIALAVNRKNLSAEQAEAAAMHIIMTGQATQAQIGAYLIALRIVWLAAFGDHAGPVSEISSVFVTLVSSPPFEGIANRS